MTGTTTRPHDDKDHDEKTEESKDEDRTRGNSTAMAVMRSAEEVTPPCPLPYRRCAQIAISTMV